MTDIIPLDFAGADNLLSEFKEFSDIRIYGTRERPLFVGTDLAKLLGLHPDIHYDRDYKSGKDYVKARIVSKDNRPREVNAFTTRGLYKIILTSKSDLSERFLDFVTIVLDELRLHGEVTLKTAVGKLQDELGRKSKYIRNLEDQVDEEHYACQTKAREVEEAFREAEQIGFQMDEVRQRAPPMASWGWELQREDLLQAMKMHHLKPVYIQSVDKPRELNGDESLEYYDYQKHYYEYDVGVFDIHLTLPKTNRKRVGSRIWTAHISHSTNLGNVHDWLIEAGMGIVKSGKGDDVAHYRDKYTGTVAAITELLDRRLLQWYLSTSSASSTSPASSKAV